MTKFREWAREVKAAGEEERGNWTPDEGSWPHRSYVKYMNANPHKVRKQENFCHYWRVAVIWSPLFSFRRAVSNAAASPWAYLVLAIIYVAVGAWLLTMGGTRAFGIVMAAVIYFGMTLVALAVWYDKEDVWYKWPLVAITAPLSLPVMGVIRLVELIQERGWQQKVVVGIQAVLVVGGVAAVCVAIVLVVVEAGWLKFLAFIAGLAVGVLVLFGIFLLLAWAGDKIKAIRRARRDRRDREWNAMTPEQRKQHIADLTAEWDPPAWLRAVGRFFVGLGDLLVLLGQVVRVKKWKICPLVEVPGVKKPQEPEDFMW